MEFIFFFFDRLYSGTAGFGAQLSSVAGQSLRASDQ